ncbi:ferrochelatase [Companilactobacillus pabuli]|jgi:ferrochelatase|uniref:ferrochelatase n=1 Tax=Companilactobacillus pabuli TaxID=2714036 RepID=UPI00065B2EFC|nr:ferrochelatase [Companilactobacillus pabuli]AKP03077.1 ferrochelatase [Companilactobacillus farciminis]AKS51377.1 ferrochelatase [Companilactobacillus farciminis]MDG5112164.1 ferrochelatase [Companilactobacillus pabuli]
MSQGLLLVNLGSPASPQTSDVKKYLQEFLSDQNVIEMPRALWQPILRGIILPLRSWRSATFYQDSWLENGSPLIVNTKLITDGVQQCLPQWNVQMAMTYGQPDIKQTLQKMQQDGCSNIILLPLFPQYTQSSTKSIIDQAKTANVNLTIIDRFYQESTYQEILAKKIQQAWDNDSYDELFFSYHSIPTAMVKHGDPYQKECLATTEAVSKLLNIPQNQIKTVYQSKFGPMPWLKPYLKNALMQAVELGKRNILIVTPSFVADCLETIEEDYVQNYQTFKASGGNKFQLVSPMNDDPDFCQFLADLAQRNLVQNS